MDFNDFINVLILGLVHCSSAKSLCFTGAGSRIKCIGVVLVSPFPPSTISLSLSEEIFSPSTISLSLSEEIFSFFSHYCIPHGSGKQSHVQAFNMTSPISQALDFTAKSLVRLSLLNN